MVAPGMSACVGSAMVPVIVPRSVCANTETAHIMDKKPIQTRRHKRHIFVSSPETLSCVGTCFVDVNMGQEGWLCRARGQRELASDCYLRRNCLTDFPMNHYALSPHSRRRSKACPFTLLTSCTSVTSVAHRARFNAEMFSP